ncbi:zinc finger protein Xfin [Biomphalaria pfeifferi]|uniref:Zinc finger protein Xfin n=1 Tax=Biomphalaria pfeifferi TaxID=112525 RepID=A0AAD8CDF6_BIOPF|nr:zinc finger protein Xfin [Biomphalaria pfeifferi]
MGYVANLDSSRNVKFTSFTQGQISCSHCSEVFTDHSCMRSHFSKVHGYLMPFSCTLCGKGYQTAMGLRYHMQAHQGQIFACPICQCKLTRKFSVKTHLRKVHNSVECLSCSGGKGNNHFETNFGVNNPSSSSSMLLQPLSKSQNISTDVSCPHCFDNFASPTYLNKHIFKYHADNTAPLICSLCRKGYQTARGLAHHMQSHKGKTFMCPVCDAKFTHKFSIKTHLRQVHFSARCVACSGVYKIGPDFDHHVISYVLSSPKERLPQRTGAAYGATQSPGCSKCLYCTESVPMSQYRVHMRECHHNCMPYYCSLCGKGQTSKKRVFPYDVGRNTLGTPRASKGTKTVFQATYIKDDEYLSQLITLTCPYCPAALSKSDLRVHISHNHGSYMPFACSICGGLSQHQRPCNSMKRTTLLTTSKFKKDFQSCDTSAGSNPIKKTQVSQSHSSSADQLCDSDLHALNLPYSCAAREDHGQRNYLHYESTKQRSEQRSLPRGVVLGSNLSGQTETCPICYQILPMEYLKAHISRNHGSTMAFSCYLCGRGYQSQAGLSNHMDVHQGKTVLCPVCDNKFSRNFTLKRHLKVVHKSAQCPTCYIVLNIGPAFNEHVLTCEKNKLQKHQKPNRPLVELARPSYSRESHGNIKTPSLIRCSHCPAVFYDYYSLNAHTSQTHRIELPFICQICGKGNTTNISFTSADGFRKMTLKDKNKSVGRPHFINQQIPMIPNAIHCYYCPETFFIKHDLKVHLSQFHGDQLPYVCSLCGKRRLGHHDFNYPVSSNEYPQQFSQYIHLKDKPSSILNGECPHCHKVMAQSAIKQHVSSFHQYEMPFSCTLCGKGFLTSSGLKPVEQQDSRAFQHVQHHSLKTPFSASSNLISFPPFDSSFTSAPVRCVQCGVEFYTLASYRWHMSHYHLRFNCSICGKAFRSRGGLGFHMEAHRGRNFVCPIYYEKYKDLIYGMSASKQHLSSSSLHKTATNFSSKMCSPFPQESHTGTMLNPDNPSLKQLLLDSNMATTCPVCSVPIESRILYQKHMNSEHRGAGYLPFVCQLCLMGFFSASGLQKHTEAHAGKRFVCQLCHGKFTHKHHLKRHSLNVHGVVISD